MSETILFQGDSITDAYRARDNDNYAGNGYPCFVKGSLGLKYPGKYSFYNRGVSGDRIVDVYARMKRDIINLNPDYISFLIGINDVWHEVNYKNGVDAEKFEKVYSMMISEIMDILPSVRIMILEPFFLPGAATQNTDETPDKYEYFAREVPLRAAATKRVAEKYGLPFIPLQEKFDEACKSAEASYWLIDGVHPSAMGHEIIKNEWIKYFETIKR